MATFNTGHIRQLTVRTNSIGDTFLDDNMGAGISNAAAPVITNISATDHGTYFTVTWTTNIAATSQLDYGTTSAYGSSTTLDATLVTSHSVSIDIHTLSYNTLYHYRCKSGATNSADQTTTTLAFPAGDDGALSVPVLQVIYWDSGSVHDHTTIDVSGSIFIYPTSNPLPVSIGYTTSFELGGIITSKEHTGQGTFAITAPDGTSLSYDIASLSGGSGGVSGSGIGGNGGSGGGNDGSSGSSGDDGWDPNYSSPSGGGGGSQPSDGGNGGDGNANDNGDATGGGGGGGGGGNNGGCFYIKGNGDITGGGWFDCTGSNSSNGGNGGNATDFFSATGGSGGGGGAGGCGGKIYQRRHGGSNFFTDARVAGGFQGNGGSGGSATALITVDGASGSDGTLGVNGTNDNATY